MHTAGSPLVLIPCHARVHVLIDRRVDRCDAACSDRSLNGPGRDGTRAAIPGSSWQPDRKVSDGHDGRARVRCRWNSVRVEWR